MAIKARLPTSLFNRRLIPSSFPRSRCQRVVRKLHLSMTSRILADMYAAKREGDTLFCSLVSGTYVRNDYNEVNLVYKTAPWRSPPWSRLSPDMLKKW